MLQPCALFPAGQPGTIRPRCKGASVICSSDGHDSGRISWAGRRRTGGDSILEDLFTHRPFKMDSSGLVHPYRRPADAMDHCLFRLASGRASEISGTDARCPTERRGLYAIRNGRVQAAGPDVTVPLTRSASSDKLRYAHASRRYSRVSNYRIGQSVRILAGVFLGFAFVVLPHLFPTMTQKEAAIVGLIVGCVFVVLATRHT